MRTALVTCFVGLLIAASAELAQGQTVFFDTFRDGDAQDGMPVTWEPIFTQNTGGNTLVGVENRSMIVGPTADNSRSLAGVPEIELGNTSIRSRVRMQEGSTAIGLFTRSTTDAGGNRGFSAVDIRADGQVIISSGSIVSTEFDPLNEDLIMQLDVLGRGTAESPRRMAAWVWRPGEPMPSEPLLMSIGSAANVPPRIVGVIVDGNAGEPYSGAFRYVHVASSHIPEPSTAIMAALAAVGCVAIGRRRCL